MADEYSLFRIVGCARPKSETQPKYESTQGAQRSRGTNLYVCNLDDRVDDDYLRDLFSPFGKIISSRVMYDSNQCPRGFGFVCFSTPEEAASAIEHMKGHVVFSQSLHVDLAAREKRGPGYNRGHYAEKQQRVDFQNCAQQEVMHSRHEQYENEMQINRQRKNEDHRGQPDGKSTVNIQDTTGLSSRLASLLNQKTFSDVRFAVGNVVFNAHKLVLALSSEMFASMFYGEHALSEFKVIVVSDVTPGGFSQMLQYMYTDHLEFHNAQDAKEALKVAQKYCVSELQRKCQDYLFGDCEITTENVCFIFENADISGISDVMDKCQKIFQTETKDVLKSSHFLSSNVSTVEAILKNDHLNIESELDLINAIVAWGREECKRNNASPDTINVRTCVGPLLKYIRFLSLPTDVFFKVIQETELLSTPEACMITLKLSQPELSIDLPVGICQKTDKRVPPAASKLSFCYHKFPLVETEQILSTGFKDDIVSTMHITVQEGQVKIRGVILKVKKLRFQEDVLDISVDVHSNSTEYCLHEKIQVSEEPITVMLKQALHIPRKQSAIVSIRIEDLRVNRCYSCCKSEIIIEKQDTTLKVQLSGNRTNRDGSFLFPVHVLLYEKCQL